MKASVGSSSATDILKGVYGLDVIKIRTLPGYYDLNFHVTVSKVTRNPFVPDALQFGYVLKVTNSEDSKRVDVLQAHNEMAAVLQKSGFPIPIPVPAISGKNVEMIRLPTTGPNDEEGLFAVRVLEYIPGMTYNEAGCPQELLQTLGRTLGRFHTTLKSCNWSVLEEYDTLFRLTRFQELSPLIGNLNDGPIKQIAIEVLQDFKSRVCSHLSKLQRGITHGDFSASNTIVASLPVKATKMDATDIDTGCEFEADGWKICGLIDIDDSSVNYIVFDVAIALASFMQEMDERKGREQIAALFYSGFVKETPLTAFEEGIIQVCICARFIQLFVNGIEDLQSDPNNSHIQMAMKSTASCLEDLWKIPSVEFLSTLTRAI